MVWLLILFIILFIFLAYILFAPVHIEIDSTKDLYGIRFHRLLRISLKTDDDLLLELKLMRWKKRFSLSNPMQYKQQENRETTKPMKRKVVFKLNKIVPVLKSFKVKTFDISVDSHNMQLNGILFPIVYFAGFYFNKNIRISFVGENHLILYMNNTLGRMAAAYIWT
jgi:hypothetical protein